MSVYMSVLGWLSGKHSTSHGSCASCPSLDVPLKNCLPAWQAGIRVDV